MKVIKADTIAFGSAPLKREGEWVTYDTKAHKRHVVTYDTVTTLDNKEVHHANKMPDPMISLEELFSEEYEQYAQRALRDNEAVHNVRGPTVDLSLWNDTQISEEY